MKMKSKDHIYVLRIDSNLDETIKKFQEQLEEGEQIVAQTFVPATHCSEINKMVITTRKQLTDAYGGSTNLLLEEIKKRNQK
jgi:hypothetical protein